MVAFSVQTHILFSNLYQTAVSSNGQALLKKSYLSIYRHLQQQQKEHRKQEQRGIKSTHCHQIDSTYEEKYNPPSETPNVKTHECFLSFKHKRVILTQT